MYVYEYDKNCIGDIYGTASGGAVRTVPMNCENRTTKVYVALDRPCTLTYQFTDLTTGEIVQQGEFSENGKNKYSSYSQHFSSTSGEHPDLQYYGYDEFKIVKSGIYMLTYSFSENVSYGLAAAQVYTRDSGIPPSEVYIKESGLTLAVGESAYLTCMGFGLGWSDTVYESLDTGVATFKRSGYVTAKKAGETYVRIASSDGYEDYCHIIVKENTYRKNMYNRIKRGKKGYAAGEISYDKKGRLHITYACVNRSKKKINRIGDAKLVVRNKKGKKIAVVKIKGKSVFIAPNGMKVFKVTIPKKKLKSDKKEILWSCSVTMK